MDRGKAFLDFWVRSYIVGNLVWTIFVHQTKADWSPHVPKDSKANCCRGLTIAVVPHFDLKMNERILYLNTYTSILEHDENESDHLLFVPWNTVLALYVLDQSKVFSSPSPPCINLIPVCVANTADVFPIKKRFVEDQDIKVLENTHQDPIISSCALPILFLPSKLAYLF
jgi:hypothetical protein